MTDRPRATDENRPRAIEIVEQHFAAELRAAAQDPTAEMLLADGDLLRPDERAALLRAMAGEAGLRGAAIAELVERAKASPTLRGTLGRLIRANFLQPMSETDSAALRELAVHTLYEDIVAILQRETTWEGRLCQRLAKSILPEFDPGADAKLIERSKRWRGSGMALRVRRDVENEPTAVKK